MQMENREDNNHLQLLNNDNAKKRKEKETKQYKTKIKMNKTQKK